VESLFLWIAPKVSVSMPVLLTDTTARVPHPVLLRFSPERRIFTLSQNLTREKSDFHFVFGVLFVPWICSDDDWIE
jgi:hypothetical protein